MLAHASGITYAFAINPCGVYVYVIFKLLVIPTVSAIIVHPGTIRGLEETHQQ
jgi:hypothetical protein